MNYNTFNTIAFEVEKMGLDVNGNTVRKLTFYKTDKWNSGKLAKYKTIKTNEAIEHLTNDRVIEVWG
jgi:hypothetical protein